MAEFVGSETNGRVVNNAMRHQYRVLSDAEKASMLAIKDSGLALEYRRLGDLDQALEVLNTWASGNKSTAAA